MAIFSSFKLLKEAECFRAFEVCAGVEEKVKVGELRDEGGVSWSFEDEEGFGEGLTNGSKRRFQDILGIVSWGRVF